MDPWPVDEYHKGFHNLNRATTTLFDCVKIRMYWDTEDLLGTIHLYYKYMTMILLGKRFKQAKRDAWGVPF